MRVGILGAGGMGNRHATQYRKMSDLEIFFYDRDPLKCEEFAAKYDATATPSPEHLIKKVDIVDVCLPNDMHLDAGLKAVAQGGAVFMEKPIARTLDEAAQLLRAVERARVPFMPGHVVRFFPEFKTGHRLVTSGSIGTPAAARMRRGGLAPTGGSENWFMDHERSGGILVDLAVHDFDWLRWTLGEVKFLYARSLGATRGAGPDYAVTTLTFDSGAVAHVETTWMDPSGFRASFEVAGSGGIIEYDSKQAASLRTHTPGKTVWEGVISAEDDPYYQELSAFVNAVKTGAQPPVTGHDGFMALSISLAALESAQTGRVVTPARA